jgi:hypothetical protein
MSDVEDAILVFTARSPERIVREGGSQAWVLNAARAKNCTWLVCTQNRHNPDHEFSDATEPHGTAFLLGRVSGIRETSEESKDGKQRWLVSISEFARVNVPDAWDHGRNPVRYTSLEKLGIDPVTARFQPMPPGDAPPSSTMKLAGPTAGTLTIAEAKKALAATFGVKPDSVEITIRG